MLYAGLIESSPCADFPLIVPPAGEAPLSMIQDSPLTRKLSAFVALSEPELAVLERLHQRRRSFVAGRDLVHQGQSDKPFLSRTDKLHECFFLSSPDGQAHDPSLSWSKMLHRA
ncbi:hypothetical protein [Albidovulum litorale]|uniref:hypothetical protein n=1 Tax=Albidovulum litorale TaxID=2984134 RepID=UPI0039919EE1